MIYDINKYTEFLCRTKITPNQFYICYLLYNKEYSLLQQYINEVGLFKKQDLHNLIDKGFILNMNPKADVFNIIDLCVTLEFTEFMLVEPEEAVEEFFKEYPDQLVVNGIKVPAKGLTFSDEAELKKRYIQIIKKNKFLHLDIINIVKDYKKNNNGYATMKIDKFVTSQYWLVLQKKGDKVAVKPRIY